MGLRWVDGKTLAPAELRRIAAIDNEIPVPYDPTWVPDEKALDARAADLRKSGEKDFFQVVYEDTEVVGFHVIRDTGRSVAYISTLWVHPRLRKSGLGKRLKEAGILWARERGCRFLETSCHAGNKRMTEINLKNGFEPFSTIFRMKL